MKLRREVFANIVLCLWLCNLLNAQQAATVTEVHPQSLVAIQTGELPIILSAPHGGTQKIGDVAPRSGEGLEKKPGGFVTARDSNTEELALEVAKEIQRRFGKKPYYVVSQSHRRYLDPNRPPEQAFEDSAAASVYNYYHQSLDQFCQQVFAKFHGGLLIDIHGQGSDAEMVFRGTKNGLTVKLLRERHGDLAHTGPESLFAMLDRRGWKVHPRPFDGAEQAGFTGGYIVQHYGSHQGTGIDAIQLEFGANYRKASQRATTAATLVDAIAEYSTKYLKYPPLAAAIRPASIEVAVYVGEGTSSSKSALLGVLAQDPRLQVRQIQDAAIVQEQLQGARVIIHPGGSGSAQGKALGEAGRKVIRDFVSAGGGYVGVCAGAYLASSDYEWSLHLLDAKVVDRQHWARGFGPVEIKLSQPGLDFFDVKRNPITIYYHQGPLLAPAQREDLPDYEVLAEFAGDIAKNGASPGVMPGTTAIAASSLGKGRVVCFSPHPEKSVGLESYLLKAIHWAASGERTNAATD